MEDKNLETQEHDEKDSSAQEDYLDFELEIGMGSGRSYPVAVRSAAGEEARGVMQFPFDDLALENQLLTLQNALLRSGGKPRHILIPEEQSVQDFGRTLFATLFTGDIENLYIISQREAALKSKGLRLKLRILVPEMAALPWEFLYDPRQEEYLCLSRNTPVVRYLEVPQPPQPLSTTLPLQILGMIAAPTNLPALDVKREKERMEKALEPLQQRGLAQLTWLPGQTWRDVQQAMRGGPWHVFHFIGHGGFDSLSDEGLIAFEDDQGQADLFRAIQLGRLLADHRSLQLVVLNACEGARSGRHDIFSSAAANLVRHGITAVLAMQYTITDAASIVFSCAFYEALADGWPIDAAVSEARKAVCFEVENTLEWGVPVLFMRSPDGVLFTFDRSISSPPSQPPLSVTPPRPPAVGSLLSRRALLIGLAGLATAGVAAGGIWLASHGSSPTPTPVLRESSPTATLSPQPPTSVMLSVNASGISPTTQSELTIPSGTIVTLTVQPNHSLLPFPIYTMGIYATDPYGFSVLQDCQYPNTATCSWIVAYSSSEKTDYTKGKHTFIAFLGDIGGHILANSNSVTITWS